eukprot:368310_1
MSLYVVIIYTIPILYNTINAATITCEIDPLFGLQFDHNTTETFGTETTYDIGWKKVMYCQDNKDSDMTYPTGSSTYMESIAPYAISIKIVPDDLNDPLFDKYAVYGKVCQNPIISLNNLYELSYTINVTTFKPIGRNNVKNWYGLHNSKERLSQDANCPDTELITPSPITRSLFQSCGRQNGLQIYQPENLESICQFDHKWRNENKTIAIYFGFDVHKQYMCDGIGNGGTKLISDTRRRLADINTNIDEYYERRNLQEMDYYDITTGELYNTPCMTVEIKLQTENVLPTNNEPDAATNMIVIGKALGGDSSGTLTIPDIIINEDDITTTLSPNNEEFEWDIDPNCLDETQVQDSYFPKEIIDNSVNFTYIIDTNGFIVSVSYTTPPSILYVFEIDALPITISHTCSNNIDIIGEIYENGNVVAETDIISVFPNETGNDINKLLPFNSTIQLSPGTDFIIEFKGYFIEECNGNNILIGNQILNRRRMQDEYFTYDDLKTNANPNSCLFSKSLARSNAMKTGVKTMCNNNLGDNRARIEAGMFKIHTQQTAIRDFLVRPGSIEVYDETGSKIFYNSDWPVTNNGHAIKKPCIAIDEDTNRVFAIGGYDKTTGDVVDTIKVWQFDDDTLTSGGPVEDINDWVLDRPRYGSMCKYWKADEYHEYLIVISGMADTTYEFTNKLQFYDDIRIFPIPKDIIDLQNWQNSKSLPETGTIKIAKLGVIDSRLFLYNSHILYWFGGKTHKGSKTFVSRFDLNDILFNTVNAASLQTMTLTKAKSLPMIDETLINMGTTENPEIKSCYMIFAGQSYEDYGAVETTSDGELGLTFDNLQLFCNPQIQIDGTTILEPIQVNGRRRLELDNIITLSEFDKLMFEKGKQRRRLSEEEGETSEVFIRDYEYALDGIWYDFNVKIEMCYNNNNELNTAQQIYNNVIASKPNGQEWIEYTDNINEKILNESINAYIGWSNGFGLVNVNDLNILSVRYDKCRAIIKIYINEGCDHINFEWIDTDIMYTDLKFYESLYDIGDPNTFNTQPTEELEQIILDHSCNTDNNIGVSAYNFAIDLLENDNENEHSSAIDLLENDNDNEN